MTSEATSEVTSAAPEATDTPLGTYGRTRRALETGEASVTLHASVTLFTGFTFVTAGTLGTLQGEEGEQSPGHSLSPSLRGHKGTKGDKSRASLTAGPRAPAGPGGPAGPWGPWDRREGDRLERPAPPAAAAALGQAFLRGSGTPEWGGGTLRTLCRVVAPLPSPLQGGVTSAVPFAGWWHPKDLYRMVAPLLSPFAGWCHLCHPLCRVVSPLPPWGNPSQHHQGLNPGPDPKNGPFSGRDGGGFGL